MKKVFLTTCSLLLFAGFLLPQTVHARKRLPRAAPVKKSSGGTPVFRSRGVTVKVKFRGDRLGIIADFSNLSIATSVDYALTYNTRGTTQAVTGTLSPEEDPTTRDLIFGTCSGGVCRFDSGITNARFIVTTYLTNGLKIVKPFRLKV